MKTIICLLFLFMYGCYYKASTPSITGDINNDGVVDEKDLNVLNDAYGTYKGEPKWNPNADINSDGSVDGRDVIILRIIIANSKEE